MIRVYYGGHLTDQETRVWASPDFDYGATFAELHESAVWMLTLEVSELSIPRSP